MGLEAATYLADLNSANPTGSDGKSQGDDHIRLIKACLLATFPSFTGTFINWSEAQLNDAMRMSGNETVSGNKDFTGYIERTVSGDSAPLTGCFAFHVQAGAAGSTNLPTGWGIATPGTGQIDITHNLGLSPTSLSISVIPHSGQTSATFRLLSSGSTTNKFRVLTTVGSAFTATDLDILVCVFIPGNP